MLDSTRTIYGNFCEVWHEGQWVTNAQSVEATVEIGTQEITVAGTRWVGYKTTSLTGTGALNTYKINSDFIRLIGSIALEGGKPYVTELILKLDDPEAFGAERIRLKHVQFTTIPLGKFEAGSVVQEELPFTFTGYDLLDVIVSE